MKLTVIIPVYQVATTLRRCVESVVAQDVDDSEILLVDDGSTDGSAALCDQLADEYANISVVHKANGGLSDARNAGLNIARGEYVTFVDSDDFIAKGTYKGLLEALDGKKNAGFIEFTIIKDYGGPAPKPLILTDEIYNDSDDYWLRGHAYAHTYACNKIFRRSLFDKVRFPVGKVFEDAYTLPLLMAQCDEIMTASTGMYYYCFNGKGITQTATGRQLEDLLEAHLKYIDSGNKIDGAFYAHVLNIQLDVYELTGKEPKLPVMPFKDNYKLKLLHLIGLKKLCKINKLIHRMTKRYH